MEDTLITRMHSEDAGFRVLLDSGPWRIGCMRFDPAYTAQQITHFQRHEGSDEAFILLCGQCCLLAGDGTEDAGNISAVDMVAQCVYTIRRNVWHNHLLTPGSVVWVVENSSVAMENSPCVPLTDEQRATIDRIAQARGFGRNQP